MGNESFVEGMYGAVQTINNFNVEYSLYQKNQTRNKISQLSKDIEKVKVGIEEIQVVMLNASKVKLVLSKGTENLSRTAMEKNSELTKVVATANKVKKMITATDLMRKLKKRNQEHRRNEKDRLTQLLTPDLKITCYNSTLSWNVAYINLECNVVLNKPPSVTNEEIRSCASIIEKETFVNALSLPVSNGITECFCLRMAKLFY